MYYTCIKTELNSEYTQTTIEKNSIENNLNNICHCYFKDDTAFVILGNNIAEAFNSDIKEGDVKLSANMTNNNSGLTHIQTGQHQKQIKKVSYYQLKIEPFLKLTNNVSNTNICRYTIQQKYGYYD